MQSRFYVSNYQGTLMKMIVIKNIHLIWKIFIIKQILFNGADPNGGGYYIPDEGIIYWQGTHCSSANINKNL